MSKPQNQLNANQKGFKKNPMVNFTIVAMVMVFAFLVFGFFKFANMAANTANDVYTTIEIPSADAIVVLTGGTNRLDQALKLLQKKKNTRLLISGVNPNTSKSELQKFTKTDPALFDCCIDIDHKALDTIGNASQTTLWAKQHGFKSLIVVTSNYHMPRSLLLLKRADASIDFIPYAIASSRLNYKSWSTNFPTLKVLMKEYIKYGLAYWGLI